VGDRAEAAARPGGWDPPTQDAVLAADPCPGTRRTGYCPGAECRFDADLGPGCRAARRWNLVAAAGLVSRHRRPHPAAEAAVGRASARPVPAGRVPVGRVPAAPEVFGWTAAGQPGGSDVAEASAAREHDRSAQVDPESAAAPPAAARYRARSGLAGPQVVPTRPAWQAPRPPAEPRWQQQQLWPRHRRPGSSARLRRPSMWSSLPAAARSPAFP